MVERNTSVRAAILTFKIWALLGYCPAENPRRAQNSSTSRLKPEIEYSTHLGGGYRASPPEIRKTSEQEGELLTSYNMNQQDALSSINLFQ